MAEHSAAPAIEIPEHHRTTTGQSHRKVLMWAFLGSETMLFGALIGTFMVYHNNTGGGPIRQDVLSSLWLVSGMAFVLLISSFTMVLGLNAARKGDQTGMTVFLLATAFLGLFFIGSQGFEFYSFANHHHAVYDTVRCQELAAQGVACTVDNGGILGHTGLTPRVNLFGGAFMTLTGFHGAHVTAGILWLTSVVFMVRVNPSKPRLPFKAVAIIGGFIGTVVFGGMVAILWREIGWWSVGSALPAGVVAFGVVVTGFTLKYLRDARAETPPELKQSLLSTAISRVSQFLSGVPGRAGDQQAEGKDRHRRYTAFLREEGRAPAATAEDATVLAMEEYEEHRLTEERVLNVEILGLYWHFVDVVWIVIFTVVYLLQGEHTFK